MPGLDSLQEILRLKQPVAPRPAAAPGAASLLQGLDSQSNIQNYTNTPGALDVLSAESDLMPGEAELRQAQAVTGPGISRQEIQDSGMAALRRQLGLEQRATDRATAAKSRLQSEEDAAALQRQKVAADAQVQSTEIAANSRAAQAEAAANSKQALLDALLGRAGDDRSVSVSGVGSVGAEPRGGAGTRRAPTAGLLKGINDAQGAADEAWFWQKEGAQKQLLNAVSAAMTYEGSLEGTQQGIAEAKAAGLVTAEDAIADMKANGVPLTPYQETFIRLTYGQ